MVFLLHYRNRGIDKKYWIIWPKVPCYNRCNYHQIHATMLFGCLGIRRQKRLAIPASALNHGCVIISMLKGAITIGLSKPLAWTSEFILHKTMGVLLANMINSVKPCQKKGHWRIQWPWDIGNWLYKLYKTHEYSIELFSTGQALNHHVEITWYQSYPCIRADSRLAPSQWETLLQSDIVSHWLGDTLIQPCPCIIWIIRVSSRTFEKPEHRAGLDISIDIPF